MSLDPIATPDSQPSDMPTRLGSYLIEAGLITPAQVAVVLNDQNLSQDMRFGEVLVARGWVKPETIEFVIKRVLEPERQAALDRQNAKQCKVVPAQNIARNPVCPSTNSHRSQPTPPPMSTTPPRVTTPPQPIARAKSIDGDFEFEILDDITLSLPNSQPATGIKNDRKPLPSVPDGGGVNWAG